MKKFLLWLIGSEYIGYTQSIRYQKFTTVTMKGMDGEGKIIIVTLTPNGIHDSSLVAVLTVNFNGTIVRATSDKFKVVK